MTKQHRLCNAFAREQNYRQERGRILGFIRKAMRPERFLRCSERFEPMRAKVNGALAFAGLAVDASGTLGPLAQATTLSEAQRRAQELRADLASRGVHLDVLRFCREELYRLELRLTRQKGCIREGSRVADVVVGEGGDHNVCSGDPG